MLPLLRGVQAWEIARESITVMLAQFETSICHKVLPVSPDTVRLLSLILQSDAVAAR